MERYRIDQSKGLEFGLYTLGDHMPNPHTGERISAAHTGNHRVGKFSRAGRN